MVPQVKLFFSLFGNIKAPKNISKHQLKDLVFIKWKILFQKWIDFITSSTIWLLLSSFPAKSRFFKLPNQNASKLLLRASIAFTLNTNCSNSFLKGGIWAARAASDFPLEKEQTCWRYLVHSCMFFKRAVQSFLISLNTLSINGIPCRRKWSKKDLEKIVKSIFIWAARPAC